MSSLRWDGLSKIQEILASYDPEQANKVDMILASVMETVADILPTASAPVLREGVKAAKAALETLDRTLQVDESSPSYVAGRLAAVLDVLGYAAYQTADEAVVDMARKQPYALILAALATGAMRNVDLAAALQKDEPRVSKWLAALREHGAVTSHKRGRELFNALTPVGRLLVEQGWQDERRAPLEASQVHSLEAHRFDLSKRRAASHAQPAALPRLSMG